MIATWKQTLVSEGWLNGRAVRELAHEAGLSMQQLHEVRLALGLADRDHNRQPLDSHAGPLEPLTPTFRQWLGLDVDELDQTAVA